jgi:hypothetical protein
MIIAAGILKFIGLQAASGLIEIWQKAGAVIISLGLLFGGLYGVAELGRHWERQTAAIRSVDAEKLALKRANETREAIEGQAAADEAVLAKLNEEGAKLRATTSDDSRVLFRADDGWLRAKRAGKAGG